MNDNTVESPNEKIPSKTCDGLTPMFESAVINLVISTRLHFHLSCHLHCHPCCHHRCQLYCYFCCHLLLHLHCHRCCHLCCLISCYLSCHFRCHRCHLRHRRLLSSRVMAWSLTFAFIARQECAVTETMREAEMRHWLSGLDSPPRPRMI